MNPKSDGSTADYYKLPDGATELQDLISHRDMNAQVGEIFRACYRYGLASHSDKLRDAKKVLFYAQAEIKRLEGISDKGSNEKRAVGDSGAPLVDYADGEWHNWRGGECPVDGGMEVKAYLRGGKYLPQSQARGCDWAHEGGSLDIIRFKVVK